MLLLHAFMYIMNSNYHLEKHYKTTKIQNWFKWLTQNHFAHISSHMVFHLSIKYANNFECEVFCLLVILLAIGCHYGTCRIVFCCLYPEEKQSN